MTARLFDGDLQMALEDDRHLGFGYATADVIGSASRRRSLDRAVVAVANEVGLDSETLFHWTNSKWGRWLVDGVHGRNEPPTRATVRAYLNPSAVAEALDGVEVLS